MAKKGSLFFLIKSMTKSEKRYFKLFAGAMGDSQNYLQLFDVIEKMSHYDEKVIRETFQGQTFLKQLHVTKNYLSRLIMKSLRNYHHQLSVSARLKDMLRDVEILFSRELYDHCQDTLRKAKKLAQKFERQLDLLEIYSWERRLLLAEAGAAGGRAEVNQLLDRERNTLDQLDIQNEYWDMTINVFELMNELQLGWNSFGNITDHPLLKRGNRAETLQSKTLYYHILHTYHLANENQEEALNHLDQLINLLEQHPERIRDNPSSYITAMNNKIGMLLRMKKYDDIPLMLGNIREIPQKYGLKSQSQVAMKIMLQTYNVELEMYRDTGRAAEAAERVGEISEYLEKHSGTIPLVYRLLIQYQIAHLYFLHRQFANALRWVNEIFGLKSGTLREDIQSNAHLLRLVVHFELGNTMVLRYSVDACRRFLRKKREPNAFEQVLLKFFSTVSTATRDQYPVLYQKMLNDLDSNVEPQMLAHCLDYLDVKTWVEEKLAKANRG